MTHITIRFWHVLAVVSLVVVGAVAISDSDGLKLTPQFNAVEACRSVEQVEALLGPPGTYTNKQQGYDLIRYWKPHGPGKDGNKFVNDAAIWVGDDGLLLIIHVEGRIQGVHLLPPEERDWSERIGDWFRSRFG